MASKGKKKNRGRVSGYSIPKYGQVGSYMYQVSNRAFGDFINKKRVVHQLCLKFYGAGNRSY